MSNCRWNWNRGHGCLFTNINPLIGPLPGRYYVFLTDLATLFGLENIPSVKEVGRAFKKMQNMK